MTTAEREIIYLKCDSGSRFIVGIYVLLSIYFVYLGFVTPFTLYTWLGALFLICLLGMIGASRVLSQAGVQFIDDGFKLYSFPFWDKDEESDVYPVLEYDDFYTGMSNNQSYFKLKNGTFIPVTIQSDRALQVHRLLEDKKQEIVERQQRILGFRSERWMAKAQQVRDKQEREEP